MELRDVYWIGGGSAAGKSTVARLLAARYDLRVYATDDVMARHAQRLSAREAPALARFAGMTMDERWVHRSPEAQLDEFHWFRGEGFPLVLDDLRGLPAGRPVVVEGFRLLPRLVAPVLLDRCQAVWLLPSPQFRRAALERRGSTWTIAGRTSDPDRALHNLLERDRLFTERLAAELAELGLPALHVHDGASVDGLVEQVAGHLRLAGRLTR